MRSQISRLLELATGHLSTGICITRDRGVKRRGTSDALKIPAATVKTRLFRARALLHKELAPELCDALSETFPFAGADCAALTERVLTKFNGKK
jgi:RNA polymerase sigma-70 factor (ECF subfamily)